MKIEFVLILLVLVGLAGLAGVSMQETRLGRREGEIAALEDELNRLEAVEKDLRDRLRPPPYVLPVEYPWISSGTGYRLNPMGGDTEALHKGVDLAGVIGDPVVAVRAGTVVEHWLVPGMHNGVRYGGHPVFGAYIVIDHGEATFSCYGHMSQTYVHEGQAVKMGELIGRLGDTGITTGPHLHYEIVIDGLKYLAEGK